MVTIAVPNSVEWVATAIAAWKVGAIPQPVSSRLPWRELAEIISLARPKVIVGSDDASLGVEHRLSVGYRPPVTIDASPVPDVVAPGWKAPTSGGSTGRAKLIVSGDPAVMDLSVAPPLRLRPDGCLVMPGPLFHNGPATYALRALLWGNHVVLLPRFDPAVALQSVENYGADMIYLVPTMMKRIWRLPEERRNRYDLSSLETVWHLAEPCPPWLKREWISWLGPGRIYELYTGTEAQAMTAIAGREWLRHEGSVGRPVFGEFQICDPNGEPVPVGVVGEVWLRSARATPAYRYVGAEARTRAGGWESLGDMGWVDADGYLYLSDRMQDMILCGGENVYPAEVEAAIAEHPAVRSCAVIGLPDDDKGQRVHAVVEADMAKVGATELSTWTAERIALYKVPRTWEFVNETLRNEAGKVRRSELRAQRIAATGTAPAARPTPVPSGSWLPTTRHRPT
jgi:bile acid-coenzyme A ligase